MVPIGADRRTAERYQISAPVYWSGGEGVVLDVSTGGFYFLTTKTLATGQTLQLQVIWPRQPGPIEARGTVVRIEDRHEVYGVGLRVDSFEARGASPTW